MKPVERVELAINSQIPDTVPVFPRDLTLGLDVLNYTTPEVCAGSYDPVKSARSVIALQRILGHDAVVGAIHYMGMEVPPLGGKLTFPERGIPVVEKHPFAGIDDLERIEVPDPDSDPLLSNILRSYEMVVGKIGNRIAVIPNVEGPLTKAGLLRGIENLCMDMIGFPEIAERIVRISEELICDFIRATAERGVSPFVFLASATDNPDLFGEEVFRKYTLPVLRRIVKMAGSWGLKTVFHPHGTFTDHFEPLVEESIDTGIAGFQFPEGNDLRIAKMKWGRSTCVMGGIDVRTTLLLSPECMIRQEVERIMEACKPGGNYIFMCSGSLHRGLPIDRLKVMMSACREFGAYHHRKRNI